LSEDEAQRRCRAARVARQFPVLFEMLADASIHLTGIVLLAPYLTAENHREVLARARYRRKREIELLVAELAPQRDVPALIEPLSARVGAPQRGGWAAFAQSSAGWVRELVPGDGPTQAPSVPDDGHEELVGRQELDTEDASAPARREVEPQPPPTASVAAHAADGSCPVNAVMPALDARPAETPTSAPVAGERRVAATRYKVQFTADQAYVDLLEQARALLWHRLPSGNLAQLQRLALEALVEKLVCRKYGAGARSGMAETRRAHPAATDSGGDGAPAAEERSTLGEPEGSPVDLADNPTADDSSVMTETSSVIGPEPANGTRQAPEPSDAADSAPAPLARSQSSSSDARSRPEREHPAASRRSNSRHVPAAVRSAVWLRDEGRCWGAVRSSMRGACAAAPPARSSGITNGPSPEVGRRPRRTFACAVGRITSLPPSRTSARAHADQETWADAARRAAGLKAPSGAKLAVGRALPARDASCACSPWRGDARREHRVLVFGDVAGCARASASRPCSRRLCR
ncbi:MAG TPA: hypothetical protein VNN80_10470, partial [Polyangiaceae bacterium]|nr:hypothetical protein [Polyangiaceae bacterium]